MKKLQTLVELIGVQQSHAKYFVSLAEDAAPALYGGPDQRLWLDRLTIEHDNIRGALNWSMEHDPELGLRIAGSMFWFWYLRGYLGEGREWLERLVSLAGTALSAIRGRALLGLGMLAQRQGDDSRAAVTLTESVKLLKGETNQIDTSLAIGLLGVVSEDAGDFVGARALFLEGISSLESLPDASHHPLMGLTLAHLGVVSSGMGDFAEAQRYLDLAVSTHRSANDEWGAANATAYLGLLACHLRDLDRAAALMAESLTLFWSIGSLEDVSNGLANVATLAVNRGEPETAVRLFSASESLRARIGSRVRPPERELYAAAIESLRVTLGRTFEEQWTTSRSVVTQQAVEEAIAFSFSQRGSKRAATSPEIAIGPTVRERDVLRLLVEGRTDKEIATALFISPRTAQGHVARLCAKLGANTRSSAFSIAHKLGLVGT